MMSIGFSFLVSKSLLLTINCEHLKPIWSCTSNTCLLCVLSNQTSEIALSRQVLNQAQISNHIVEICYKVWARRDTMAANKGGSRSAVLEAPGIWVYIHVCTGAGGGKDIRTARYFVVKLSRGWQRFESVHSSIVQSTPTTPHLLLPLENKKCIEILYKKT